MRTKPGIHDAPGDFLDEMGDRSAQYDRAAHDLGECLEDCPHCEADRDETDPLGQFKLAFRRAFRP